MDSAFHSLLWSVIHAIVIGLSCGVPDIEVRFRSSYLLVYPETKGIPLEEMDAVFGEGECIFDERAFALRVHYRTASRIAPVLTQLPLEIDHTSDLESETSSLVGRQHARAQSPSSYAAVLGQGTSSIGASWRGAPDESHLPESRTPLWKIVLRRLRGEREGDYRAVSQGTSYGELEG